MTITTVIKQASVDDLPTLARINREAYADELFWRFAFRGWPDKDLELEYFRGRIRERFDNPQSRIFKAVVVASSSEGDDEGKEEGGEGEETIAGFVCWTREFKADRTEDLSEPVKDLATAPQSAQERLARAYFNLDFMASVGPDMAKLSVGAKEDDHYYLSAFAVDPGFQGRGIGSRLLGHCLGIADAEATRAWLVAFPASRDLYARHGFADVAHVDIDLNAWSRKPFCGYGPYRSTAMVRDPQKPQQQQQQQQQQSQQQQNQQQQQQQSPIPVQVSSA